MNGFIPIDHNQFNPTTDIQVETIFVGVSAAAMQAPTGLGPSNAIQVEFGPAINDSSDPVELSVAGALTINQTGAYRLSTTAQIGREGQSQVSKLLLRVLFNGTQAGTTALFEIDSGDVIIPFLNDQWLQLTEGLVITFEIMRDSTGNNSGGLFGQDVNVEAGSWNQDACATVQVQRLIPTP